MQRILRLLPLILITTLGLLLYPIFTYADPIPWEAVGGGIAVNPDTSVNALAIAPDGTPYIVSSPYFVYRFNGTAWENIGHPFGEPSGCDFTRYNDHIRIAVGSDGEPYIAWQSGQLGTPFWDIYVCHYNGTDWEEVGSGSASGHGVSGNIYGSTYPDIAVDQQNRPYVVWSNGSSNGNSETAGIQGRRFNGTAWEEIGLDSANTATGGISHGAGHYPKIVIDANNTPYLAWICMFGGAANQVCVLRFNGTTWEEVTPGSASFPYGMSHVTSGADAAFLKIGPGSEPYVVWQSATGSNWEIYVRRFNGTEWEEIGEGSASGGGISNTPNYNSTFPNLAFTGDGTPYVTWAEDTRTQTNSNDMSLWVRRFNGTIWEEVYPGSASYGGDGVDEGIPEGEPASLESNQAGRAYAAYSKETPSGKELRVQELQYSLDAAAPTQALYRIHNPVLTWSATTWAQGYAIEIDDARDFLTPLFTDYALTPTQLAYTVPDLRSGTYYWRISARDGSNPPTKWSPANRFVILLP